MISHLYRCSVIHINCNVTSFFFLFSLFRQASLNEAAERQYKRAAGLRPDVSTWAGGPVSTYHGNAHTRPYCKFNLQHTKCYPSFWHYVIVLLFLANSYTAEYKNGKLCPVRGWEPGAFDVLMQTRKSHSERSSAVTVSLLNSHIQLDDHS